MAIDFVLDKLVIHNFRGIDNLEINLRGPTPKILIGANNAGKSSVINAIALALNGGSFHQWSPSDSDFYCGLDGDRANSFSIKLHFWSENEHGLPAVKAVGDPILVHGIEVAGKRKGDKCSHARRLFDGEQKTINISNRTPLKAADKQIFAEHGVGYRPFNARIDDIRDHLPSVWLFKPQNIEAALYLWKTGPIAKLSKLLAERFLADQWDMDVGEGRPKRQMPEAMHLGYRFFQSSLEQFPFWKNDMKPHLENVISSYVGTQAKIDLRPDAQRFEDWIAQQLTISLATDPESIATPLNCMGDGWQSVIRLATLEAMTKYQDLVKDRIVLLLEEPETHLHPHLRRKVRKVLGRLAESGWNVICSSHSPELVSFAEPQEITKIVRQGGKICTGTILTAELNDGAKLQSKLDDKGAHEFLFSTAVVFCEGQEDAFALKLGLEASNVDCDALSVSITQCRGASGIPAFAQIARKLGLRFCAVTDEDKLTDDTINPATQKHRDSISVSITEADKQVIWPVDLEHSLAMDPPPKASAEIIGAKLSEPNGKRIYPDFWGTIDEVTNWISMPKAV